MQNVRKRKHWAGSWVTIALLFGMLIWVRLRLVTDIPRAAFAEPVPPVTRQIEAEPVAHESSEDPDQVLSNADQIR